MKTLVVISIVVSVALAAPALQEDVTDPRQSRNIHAYPKAQEFLNREKKSPSEPNITEATKTEVLNETQIPQYTGRSFGSKKPIIVKKKYGYRLYRDSEEEKASTDSHESCGRQVNVKLCDGDGKLREMLRSSGHESEDGHTSEDDMKHSIMMAKEAIENLQRDFKKLEQKSAGDNHDPQSDSDIHEDIEVTRQALEDIHKNFENLETMSLRATALKDSQATHDFHIRIANAEEEKLAMWKEARGNLHKNLEVGQNFENEFKVATEQVDQPETACLRNEIEMKETLPLNSDHMHDAQNVRNVRVQTESHSEVTTEHMREPHIRENHAEEGDMSPSASETIEVKSATENDSYYQRKLQEAKRMKEKLDQLYNNEENGANIQTGSPQSSPKMTDQFEIKKVQESDLNTASPAVAELRDNTATYWKSINGEQLSGDTNIGHKFQAQNENSMKAARPIDHLALDDLHVQNDLEMRPGEDSPHHNLFELTNPGGESWHRLESEAHTPRTLMKSALPSDHSGFQDVNLQQKQHMIDNNESEHTASLTEMKAAEDNMNNDEILAKVIDITEDNLHSENMNSQARSLTSLNTANLSDELTHQDINSHQSHNIDDNESEHTSSLIENKSAEDNTNNILTTLKLLEASQGNLLRSTIDHETEESLSLKTAIPSDSILNTQKEMRKITDAKSIEDLSQSHFAALPVMKATEEKLDLELPSVLNKHFTSVKSAPVPENMATLTDLKSDEDPSLKSAENMPLTPEWSNENRHFNSMKASQPADQIDLNEFLWKQTQQNIDQIESEDKATLSKMKSTENQLQDNWTSLSRMKAAEDNSDQSEHILSNVIWNTENRHAHLPEHNFIPDEKPHRDDFEMSRHGHQHHNHHHRHETHQFPERHHHHSDLHGIHGEGSSQFHQRLRDAMETLESEHTYQWKPSHESRSSYGAYGGYGASPIGSLGGGAVGVFPNANTGGCAIPLLLSCSPSVVSGSLAKPHIPSIGLPSYAGGSYSGGSYAGGSFSAPSYRTEDDFTLQALNKRDTKQTDEKKSTNVLRTPAILKQKTRQL